jgi:DNA-binding transcriptional LysR family regulator
MMLMASSDLLSLLPRCVARHPAGSGGVAVLDIELPPVFGPLGIVRHHSLDLSPRMRDLIECLRAEAADAAAPR